jgi:glycosidase
VGQAFFYDMNLNGVADINFQNNGGPMPVRHFTEYDPDFDPRGIQAFTSLGEAGPAPIIFQYDPATNHVPPRPALFEDPAVYNRKGRTFNFDDPQQLLQGDFPGGLKDIDTRRCDVKQEFVDIYADWIEKTDADGYRIDTIKHVEYEFWRFFTQRLRQRLAEQGKTNFLMFGEVFDGRDDLLGSFTKHDILGTSDLVRLLGQSAPEGPTDAEQLAEEQECSPGGAPLTGDQIDSVFYFSQHFQAVRDVFASAQGTDRIQALWENRPNTWGTEPNALGVGVSPADMPINFIDNHDVARFLFFARGDVAALRNALTLLFTEEGVPCVYYGTEQDLAGGNDPANREILWDTGYPVDGPTYRHIARLARIRKDSRALRRGDTTIRYATTNRLGETDAGIFAFERTGGDAETDYALVVMNVHPSKTSITERETADGPEAMAVGAAPGTTLVDVIGAVPTEVVVGSDGRVRVAVGPQSAFVFVPKP